MKINKEGYQIISTTLIILLIITALCYWFLPCWITIIVAIIALLAVTFVSAFFREPARPLHQDPNTVFSACDGKVVVIEEVEENEFLNGKCIQVSVFMSLTNVHVNWFPVGGKVLYFKHHHGKFMVAWHPKSSEDNERTTTVVECGKHRILFRQIAGFVARRIVSYAVVGNTAEQNSKCGFIKFGSRIDLFLPTDSEILVKLGDKVTGSQTPIAKLK